MGYLKALWYKWFPPKRFIPTNEWQEIKGDQLMPPGLRYRVNMETGKREAKL